MPLSPTERTQLVNDIKTQIGNYDGYGNVWFGGYGFSAPTRVYNWFRGLPLKFQLRILQMVGDRQTEIVSGVTKGEEPYNFGGGTNRKLYISQLSQALPDTMTTVHAVVTTAEAMFNPTEAQKWEQEGDGLKGLWNYAKSSRFPSGASGSNDYEKLHNWLKDLLPELYCDYVNEIEPHDEPLVRQVTVPALVYYLSWGDIQTQNEKYVEILFYPTATPNAIDNLRTKFTSYSPSVRRNKLSTLFTASTKTTSEKVYQTQQGNITFRYDLNTHSWVRRTDSISETILQRFSVQNYIEQSGANGILT